MRDAALRQLHVDHRGVRRAARAAMSAKLTHVTAPAGRLARCIDHVVIESGDEGRLFEFLHETLGLPVAWPMATWGFIREGGVCVGNANIGCNHALDPNVDQAPTIRAIALEPAGELHALLDELRTRGLEPTDAMDSGEIDLPAEHPFTPWRDGWSTAMVLGAPLAPLPFFCEYHHDVDERRRAQAASFASAGGGQLGITDLRAVVVHADVPAAAIAQWAEVIGEGIVFADGPELRVGEGTSAPALVFGVRSVDDAFAAANELGIACDRAHGVRLDPAACLGLDIRLEA